MLVEPFFWEKGLWITDLPGWHTNIQLLRSPPSGGVRGFWLQV